MLLISGNESVTVTFIDAHDTVYGFSIFVSLTSLYCCVCVYTCQISFAKFLTCLLAVHPKFLIPENVLEEKIQILMFFGMQSLSLGLKKSVFIGMNLLGKASKPYSYARN